MKYLLSILLCVGFLNATAQVSAGNARPATLYLLGDTAYAFDRSIPTGTKSKQELYSRAKRFLRSELDASENTLEGDSANFNYLESVAYLTLPNVAGLTNLMVDFTASFEPMDGGLQFSARHFTLHGFGAGAASYDFVLEKLRDLSPEQRTAVYRAFDTRWNELVTRLDRLGR